MNAADYLFNTYDDKATTRRRTRMVAWLFMYCSRNTYTISIWRKAASWALWPIARHHLRERAVLVCWTKQRCLDKQHLCLLGQQVNGKFRLQRSDGRERSSMRWQTQADVTCNVLKRKILWNKLVTHFPSRYISIRASWRFLLFLAWTRTADRKFHTFVGKRTCYSSESFIFYV